MAMLKFRFEDDVEVVVNVELLVYFKTIQNMLDFEREDLDSKTNKNDVVPISNVTSKTITLAIEWANKRLDARLKLKYLQI